MQIKGTIDSIYTKQINIKNGPRAGSTASVYHALIEGHDVNMGFKCPYAEGETVVMNVEEKYGELSLTRGNKPNGDTSSPSAPSSATKSVSGSGVAQQRSGNQFPVEPTNHATSICRQNALNRATDIMESMSIHSCVTDLTEEMEYDTYRDWYVNEVLKIAYKLTDFNTGQREMKIISGEDLDD